jgi:pSer/pThr/pTyr-binding forkhead associated (FHA) protein
MGVSLVLVQSDGRQSEIPLKTRAVIGRQTDCQIRIPSSGISRHHCELIVTGDKVTLRDMGSSNGTFVNRQKVQQAELAAGDLIAMGDLVFVVRIDGNPANVDSEEVLDEGAVPMAPAAPQPKPAPKKAAPKKHPSLLDEAEASNDDSSVAEFDFLDEDDDIKNQPKL